MKSWSYEEITEKVERMESLTIKTDKASYDRA